MNVELSKVEIRAILSALESVGLVMSLSGQHKLTKKLRAAAAERELFSAEEAIARGWVKSARFTHSFGKGARR